MPHLERLSWTRRSHVHTLAGQITLMVICSEMCSHVIAGLRQKYRYWFGAEDAVKILKLVACSSGGKCSEFHLIFQSKI